MGLFEAHEEKKNDIRVVERARLFGKLDVKAHTQKLTTLSDDGEHGHFVNIDEINAKDNPVHIPRGIPTAEAAVRRNIEDLEFDSDETNRSFEQ